LDEANIKYDLSPFMSQKVGEILYKKGNISQKALGIFASFLKRWYLVITKSNNYKVIFIHREATPLGPPIVEWYLKYILNKKIIYDFDDAIWIPNTSEQNKIAGFLKSFWKIKYLCKWSTKISAGNDFLCSFAHQSGARNVNKIPTVVNTISRYNQQKNHIHKNKLVIGWTGSHSTLKFLDELIPILEEIQENYSFTFLVISDKKPNLSLKDWTFCAWNEQTEIEDLLKIDIGVMPLKNDDWSEGKCGFKIIQYLSLGIPAVANSIGVNKLIVEHRVNGFLADNKEEWKIGLIELLEQPNLRKSMGENGKNKIEKEYSITAQKENFLNLFQ
jgi:glycosyltransferase involved in cell wall biosynthesis